MLDARKEYLNQCRTYGQKYASATAVYDAYLKEHQTEHEAYTAAADAIKAKYTDNGYEKDMDYIKLQLTHQDFLTAVAEMVTNMETIKAEMDEKLASCQETMDKVEETYQQNVQSAKEARDREKITAALTKLAAEMKSETVEEPTNKEEYDAFRLQVEGETISQWVESTADYADELDAKTSTYVKPSSGSGSGSGSGSSSKKYRCSNCGKSMSYEAMYCSDCLNSFFGGNYFSD